MRLNFDAKHQNQLFGYCWLLDWAVNCPYTASCVWNCHNWQVLLKINKDKQRWLNFFGWAEDTGKIWCWLQRCSTAILKKSKGFLISQILPVDERSEGDLKKQCVSMTSLLTCRGLKEHKKLSFPWSFFWIQRWFCCRPAATGHKYAGYQACSKISSACSYESQ